MIELISSTWRHFFLTDLTLERSDPELLTVRFIVVIVAFIVLKPRVLQPDCFHSSIFAVDPKFLIEVWHF